MKDFDQNNPHHNLDLMKHTERTMHNTNGVNMKLAAMFHDAGKPSCKDYANDTIAHYYGHAAVSTDIARAFLLRMKASADEIKSILPVIKHHDSQLTDKSFKRIAAKYSPQIAKDVIKLQLADKLAQVYNEEAIDHLRELQSRQDAILRHPFTVNDLAVNGHDLMQIGIPEGPEIGRILKEMLETVLDNPDINDREYLMSTVQA
jgi:tRNA nucleotidyltransferase (CCA-adding enzyme)